MSDDHSPPDVQLEFSSTGATDVYSVLSALVDHAMTETGASLDLLDLADDALIELLEEINAAGALSGVGMWLRQPMPADAPAASASASAPRSASAFTGTVDRSATVIRVRHDAGLLTLSDLTSQLLANAHLVTISQPGSVELAISERQGLPA